MTPQEKFLEGYDKYADAIFRHCLFRIFSRERAEELAQEVFTRTWAVMCRGEHILNFRAYLYRVANHLVIDEVRKKRPSLTVDELLEKGIEPSTDEHKRLPDLLEGRRILERLEQLPEDDREVLLLRYVDGLGPKEIADLLHCEPNTVSVRIHRAVKRLRDLYV
ncbi:sigma-70 family RNA polymerase sigma factor [Candidatus Uhrbacteria bacterium]|nr:sigma-70 family RNA polymerase sigma factor [Candidatus Uhrbacteria bacterium]